jgi:rhamnosyltransferase
VTGSEGMPFPDDRTAVGISIYRPDELVLRALLAVVRQYGGPVLLYVDGPTGQAITVDLLMSLQSDAGLIVLQTQRNAGIGAALNRLTAEAERRECKAIIFFDQDSLPKLETLRQLKQSLADLRWQGFRPAVVGPAPSSRTSTRTPTKTPRYRIRKVENAPPTYRATDFLITSGSLIELSVLRDVGDFNIPYRMDAIDVEWCFRAWAKGYSVWCVPGVTMQHSIGEGIVRMGRIAFPLQSPSRMQSYARNQFHMLRLSHVPPQWKLRTLLYVPLQIAIFVVKVPKHRLRLAGQLLRSLADGLAARFDRS